VNHNAARELKQAGTGSWFIESGGFARWKSTAGQFLWLRGKPGSGKTVLSSTIISAIMDAVGSHKPQSDSRLAYFYFSFQDERKQTVTSMLGSILMHLANQGAGISPSVQALFNRHQRMSTRPGKEELVSTLLMVLEEAEHVYLVVDAMDECSERERLSSVLDTLLDKARSRLHILATSRNEADLELALEGIATSTIDIDDSKVDTDIATHVRARLEEDYQLRAWDGPTKKRIAEALVEGAHGMYVSPLVNMAFSTSHSDLQKVPVGVLPACHHQAAGNSEGARQGSA
jgi:KaiC/GvpD/RAD55 family RecA-like ATPase